MQAVVVVEGDLTMRAAHSLSTHPGVSSVSLIGPSESGTFPVVDSVAGHDVVVGRKRAAQLAGESGLPAVVAGSLGSPGVMRCSIRGLALCLGVGLEDLDQMAVAIPGDPQGDRTFTFPSPIDQRPVTTESIESHPLLVGRGEGPLAAAVAYGASRHRTVLDSHSFLGGIALAAGVGVVLDEAPEAPTPVWASSSAYLRTAAEMGLVMGERPAQI